METAPKCKCGCGQTVTWFAKKSRWRVYIQGHYRVEADYKQREWLLMQYEVLRLTTDDIAAISGVNGSTILKQMRRHGIARRGVSESRIGRHAGKLNPAWRGGTTPERQRMYTSAAWKKTMLECFTRDDFRCRRCSSPKLRKRGLHAHHIKSWAEHPEERDRLSNLVTLCDRCHVWVHSRENTSGELIG